MRIIRIILALLFVLLSAAAAQGAMGTNDDEVENQTVVEIDQSNPNAISWYTIKPSELPLYIDNNFVNKHGRYYILGGDYTAPAGVEWAIILNASDIVFNGANHRIKGTLPNNVGIIASGSNATISNITLTGWNWGLQFNNVTKGTLENGNISGNICGGISIYNGRGVSIEKSTVSSTTQTGIIIHFNGYGNRVSDTTIINGQGGITIQNSENNTIVNNTIQNCYGGIVVLDNSNENTIERNRISDNTIIDGYGIVLQNICNENSVKDNIISNMSNGMLIWMSSCNNKFQNNTVFNSPGLGFDIIDSCNGNEFLQNKINSTRGGISVLNSSNLVIQGNQINNTQVHAVCIMGSNSGNNVVSENTIMNIDGGGIMLHNGPHHQIIADNPISGNSVGGILVYGSPSNTISGNIISDNSVYGIHVSGSTSYNNTIIGNTIEGITDFGIFLEKGPHQNTINTNTITTNNIGIILDDSTYNTIYDNFLCNNNRNTILYGTITGNRWNISKSSGPNIIGGPYIGGNVWATPEHTGFSEVTPDTDGDGICDGVYQVATGQNDYLPLKYLSGTTTTQRIGIFRDGLWVLDYNGNYVWDGPGIDRVACIGQARDIAVIGDWNGDGTDKIGIFRDGLWVLDYNGNYVWDGPGIDRVACIGQAGDIAVIGDWNGDGTDKIGIFRDGLWVLDYNGNYVWDGPGIDRVACIGQAGDIAVIGDWNGDGTDKIGIFRDGLWVLDYNGNYVWDGPGIDRVACIGQARDIAVIGDWNGDGTDKIGIFRDGLWVLDYNGNYVWDGPEIDRVTFIGQAGDVPVVGDW